MTLLEFVAELELTGRTIELPSFCPPEGEVRYSFGGHWQGQGAAGL